MPDPDLAEVDRRLLATLQEEGRLTNQELAQRVGMSTSPCWRRVRQLEEVGVIQGYAARLDGHSEAEAETFARQLMALDNVVACYAIAGDADFLLQVVARDLESYGDFAMGLRRLPRIKEMQTTIVLKEVKPYRGLPVAAG